MFLDKISALTFRYGIRFVPQFEEFTSEIDSIIHKSDLIGQWYETTNRNGRHQNEPKPKKDENLLIEHVDGQDALDSVAVLVRQFPDFEIAHGYSWEMPGFGPHSPVGQLFDEIKPIERVVRPEDAIHDEKLTDDIHDVKHFADDVEADEITAIHFAAPKAAFFCNKIAHSATECATIYVPSVQTLVYVVSYIWYIDFSALAVFDDLHVAGNLHHTDKLKPNGNYHLVFSQKKGFILF